VLEDLYERLHHKGKHMVLSGSQAQPLLVMEKAGFLDRIGRENVCVHIDAALERARKILGSPATMRSDPATHRKTALADHD
jgi:SulP family sulfate permease